MSRTIYLLSGIRHRCILGSPVSLSGFFISSYCFVFKGSPVSLIGFFLKLLLNKSPPYYYTLRK